MAPQVGDATGVGSVNWQVSAPGNRTSSFTSEVRMWNISPPQDAGPVSTKSPSVIVDRMSDAVTVRYNQAWWGGRCDVTPAVPPPDRLRHRPRSLAPHALGEREEDLGTQLYFKVVGA